MIARPNPERKNHSRSSGSPCMGPLEVQVGCSSRRLLDETDHRGRDSRERPAPVHQTSATVGNHAPTFTSHRGARDAAARCAPILPVDETAPGASESGDFVREAHP